MAIRANRYFVYTANGTNIEKRSLFTGAVIVTAAIPGGLDSVSIGLHSPCNSGIDIDSCGNVYVGSSGAVIKYDANLNLLSSVALPFRVYDVKVSYNGNVIVAGATGNNTHINRIGYVQSINMSACPPMTLFCCDANICPASPLCSNAAPITLTAETTGGTWSGTGITNASAGTFNPAVAGPGTHTVYYTLSCGKDSISITVNNCATLSVCTETNGDLTVSGGTAPYTWQYQATSTDCSSCPLGQCMPPICNGTVVHTWTTFATGTTVPPPTPTTDTIRVTDGNSNSLVINSIASLPQCSPCPTLTITTSNIVEVLCFGGTTGSFSASTTGGASPYNYTLINGATTIVTYSNVTGSQSFTGLAAGTYTLNVKDNNNCTGTTTVIISQPASAVTASITGSTNANCGQSNGSATASGSGGTGTYTYSWNTNPVQNNAIASSLSPGNYTVTVTDATSCTATASVSISNIGGPTLQTSSTIATCGVNNGTATVHATGGSGTYTYSWNTTPVQTDSTAINLAAGNYTVTVSDGSCTASTSVTVQSSSTLSLTTHTTNANCNQANGTATVIATGGTGTYFYTWNTTPVQTNPTATNLAAGSYTVSVNDGNCTVIANVTISNISGLSATISNHVNETCSNSNGSATVHANGGTLPYTYLWSNIPAQTTSVLQNVHAGTYYVTVTDSNHCIAIDTVILTNSPAPVATITTFTNASCGLSNGSATVSVTGSATPFSYIWNTSPIQHTQTASGIPGGNYFVTVSDANSCTATATITIITSQGPLVTLLDTVNASCGHSDGSADITVTGGNLPYSFNWNSTPPQNGQNLQGVPGGNYIVIVSDANGCSTSLPVTVGQNAGPTAMATSANDTCNQSKGTATVVVSGGSGTYSYLWSNSQSDSTATGLTAGTYTVTVNDGSCTVSASVIVTSAPGPIAGFTENPRILTLIDGPVTFTDNSTGNIVNWQWNFGDGNYGSGNIIQHQYANIGTYLVTLIVTDNEGCTDTTKDTISVKDYFTFYIPNAFTPNDDGLNELFYPTGTNVDPGNFTMMIFNRWGNLIFNTSKWDITAHRGEGWNGTLNNTGDINSVVIDVYVYRILVTELGGPEHEYIGRITLIP
jgi:gliding motility-associated-like protein